jgi:hypothetical protein
VLPERPVLRRLDHEGILLPRWGLLPERPVLLGCGQDDGEEGVVLPGRRLLPERAVLRPDRQGDGQRVVLPERAVLPRWAVLRFRQGVGEVVPSLPAGASVPAGGVASLDVGSWSGYGADMLAKVFTILFSITTLLGQGLCCCTFAYFTPATQHATPTVPTKSSEPRCPCCTHEPKSEGLNTEPDAPHPHKSPCPCRDKKSQIDSALPEKAASNDLTRTWSSWSCWLGCFCAEAEIVVAAPLTGDGHAAFVLYPATARLQILRC